MRSLRRGQIYLLKSDVVGKKRPVLVVSPAQLNGGIYVLAAPFYTQQIEKRRAQPWCVFFAAGEFGLDADCILKTDEVTNFKISDLRLSDGEIGLVDAEKMQLVSQALCFSLGIELHGTSE